MFIYNPNGGSTSSTSAGVPLNNSNAIALKPIRDALVRAQRGDGFARILCVGTSSTFGTGPSSEAYQWVRVFASEMRARTGLGEQCAEPLNEQTCESPGRSYISSGAGWGPDYGGSIGDLGNWRGSQGAAGTFTFTHPWCDGFTIWYGLPGHRGTWSAEIDSEGATSGLGGESGGAFIRSLTVSSGSGLGEHTLTLSAPTGGTCNPYLIEAHAGDSDLRIANFGCGGAVSDDFDDSGNAWDGLPIIDLLDPDLVIFQVGGNDVTEEVPVATFKSHLKTAVQYVWDNTPGSVILIEPIEEPGNAVDLTYGEAVREIAAEVGCMSFSVAAALDNVPSEYIDEGNNHFTNDAHTKWASALADAILR